MAEFLTRAVAALLAVFAGVLADRGWVTPPAPHADVGVLLYDEAHHNHPSDGPIRGLLEVALGLGFDVKLNGEPLDAALPAADGLLVIADPLSVPREEFFSAFSRPENTVGAASPAYWESRASRDAFSRAEILAVTEWVEAGNSLLLIVDHAPFGAAAGGLARALGVSIRNGFTTDLRPPPGYVEGDSPRSGFIHFTAENGGLSDHPILARGSATGRVASVATYVGSSLQGPLGSSPLLILSDSAADFVRAFPEAPEHRIAAAGRAQAVAFEVGKGRVVVLGETAALMTQPFGASHSRDPDGLGMGLDYRYADNRQFAENTLLWLAGSLVPKRGGGSLVAEPQPPRSRATLEAQEPESARCYALDLEDPAVLHMLGRDVQGEILVLTSEPLENSPGVTEGSRAYLGIEQWKGKGPLRPLSWYWLRRPDNAIQVEFVLPLWGISWAAEETAAGLAGEVTYHSDEVGEPARTSRFRGARVRCDRAKEG